MARDSELTGLHQLDGEGGREREREKWRGVEAELNCLTTAETSSRTGNGVSGCLSNKAKFNDGWLMSRWLLIESETPTVHELHTTSTTATMKKKKKEGRRKKGRKEGRKKDRKKEEGRRIHPLTQKKK